METKVERRRTSAGSVKSEGEGKRVEGGARVSEPKGHKGAMRLVPFFAPAPTLSCLLSHVGNRRWEHVRRRTPSIEVLTSSLLPVAFPRLLAYSAPDQTPGTVSGSPHGPRYRGTHDLGEVPKRGVGAWSTGENAGRGKDDEERVAQRSEAAAKRRGPSPFQPSRHKQGQTAPVGRSTQRQGGSRRP